MESLSCRRALATVVRLAALAGLAVCFVGTWPASASGKPGFENGEKLGTFKVVRGELNDTVAYLGNWKAEDDCEILTFQDEGRPSTRWNVTFHQSNADPLATLRVKSFGKLAAVFLPKKWLLASGTAEREWSGRSETRQAPTWSPDSCDTDPPPTWNPPSGQDACGKDQITREETGLALWMPSLGHGRYGADGLLEGTPVPSEILSLGLCPTDSTLTGNVTALPVLDGAVSRDAIAKLADAKPGKLITLSGHVNRSGPGPRGFELADWSYTDSAGRRITSGASWAGGSHTAAELDWTLTVRKVRR